MTDAKIRISQIEKQYYLLGLATIVNQYLQKPSDTLLEILELHIQTHGNMNLDIDENLWLL